MGQEKVSTENKSVYFENLDALRFLAFFLIFLYHSFHSEIEAIQRSPLIRNLKDHVFINGHLGVNFFFVLSGFLISYLLLTEQLQFGKINVGKFYLRRVLRIWPLYFAALIIGFIIFPFAKDLFGLALNESADPWYYVLFISNFDILKGHEPDASILRVLWSIAVEEQFYLVWPIIFFLVPVRFFGHVCITILAGTLLFRSTTSDYLVHQIHTLSCIGDMAIGGFGALLTYKEGAWRDRIENWRKPFLFLVYLLALAILFGREYFYSISWLKTVERPLIAFIFLLIILEQNFCRNSLFKLGRIRWFTRWGKISYGLYCLHFVGILITLRITNLLGINDRLWVVVIVETALSFLLTIVLSSISYRYLERPFLDLKKRFAIVKSNEQTTVNG